MRSNPGAVVLVSLLYPLVGSYEPVARVEGFLVIDLDFPPRSVDVGPLWSTISAGLVSRSSSNTSTYRNETEELAAMDLLIFIDHRVASIVHALPSGECR